MANSMERERRVMDTIRAVFQNKGLQPPELCGETVLDSSLGLDSMDFAEIVVRLEQEFGTDPFADGGVPGIRTISDLAALYASRWS